MPHEDATALVRVGEAKWDAGRLCHIGFTMERVPAVTACAEAGKEAVLGRRASTVPPLGWKGWTVVRRCPEAGLFFKNPDFFLY